MLALDAWRYNTRAWLKPYGISTQERPPRRTHGMDFSRAR
jgi:hypothetical protein